jgi:hypothetical protein
MKPRLVCPRAGLHFGWYSRLSGECFGTGSAVNDGAIRQDNYPRAKVRVECRRCSRRAQYDKADLIRRVGGDARLPTLRLKIAKANGCELARRGLAGDITMGREQCGMHYPDLLKAG